MIRSILGMFFAFAFSIVAFAENPNGSALEANALLDKR